MRPVRRSLGVLWLAAALAVVQAVTLIIWYWPGTMADTDTSGVWTALADDFAHGDFYRPLEGALGYGGTRYMPLFFGLHGLLIKAGAGALPAGMALTLGSAGLLVLALGRLLRELRVPPTVAWPAAALLSGLVSIEMLLLTVRGDFLAAALNLLGVAAALRWLRGGGRRWLAAAALAFAAAFLAKLTTVFGLAAVLAWGWWRGGRRRSAALGAAAAGLMLGGALLANWASDGRMLASFRAVAAGGTQWTFALTAPVRPIVALGSDPLCCVLLVPAALGWWLVLRDGVCGLAAALLAATAAVTLVIFASPGTYVNHLIDLQALALAGLALAFVRHARWRGRLAAGVAVFALGIAATWLPGVPSIRAFFGRHHKPEIAGLREHLARGGARARPVLATNPLVPILAGERPIVADAFNLELRMRRDPALRDAFYRRVRAGEFGSVVLSNWPGVFPRDVESPDDPLIGECWPALARQDTFEAGFFPALRERYRIVLVRRPYVYFMRTEDVPAAVTGGSK